MSDLVPQLVLVLAGVAAFGLQQAINGRIERRRQRKATELEYLSRAYRALSIFSNRIHSFAVPDNDGALRFDPVHLTRGETLDIEIAITDAAVYGSEEVVDAALAFCTAPGWDPAGLLRAIRKDLRKLLEYPPHAADAEFFVGFGPLPGPDRAQEVDLTGPGNEAADLTTNTGVDSTR